MIYIIYVVASILGLWGAVHLPVNMINHPLELINGLIYHLHLLVSLQHHSLELLGLVEHKVPPYISKLDDLLVLRYLHVHRNVDLNDLVGVYCRTLDQLVEAPDFQCDNSPLTCHFMYVFAPHFTSQQIANSVKYVCVGKVLHASLVFIGGDGGDVTRWSGHTDRQQHIISHNNS